MTCFTHHVLSTKKYKNGGVCAWCGKQAYTKCMKCGVYLHFFPQRGEVDYKANCFVNYHDESKFGLSRVDQPLVGKKNWRKPSVTKVNRNRKHISNLKKPSTELKGPQHSQYWILNCADFISELVAKLRIK